MGFWMPFLVIWGLLVVAPKLLVIPIFFFFRSAMRDTRDQDQKDAIWLAAYEAAHGIGGDGDGGGTQAPRRFVPSGPRLGPGPDRTGRPSGRRRRSPARSHG